MGVLRPDLVMKAIVPIVMAGIIGIYGLVVSVLISDGRKYQFFIINMVNLRLNGLHLLMF